MSDAASYNHGGAGCRAGQQRSGLWDSDLCRSLFLPSGTGFMLMFALMVTTRHALKRNITARIR